MGAGLAFRVAYRWFGEAGKAGKAGRGVFWVFSAMFVLIHNEALNAFVKVPPAFAVTLLLVLSRKTEGDQGDSTALLYYSCLQ